MLRAYGPAMSTVSHMWERDDIRLVVSAELRAWMGRRNVNQTTLAQALGLSQSQLSKRLKGSITFDIVELERAARFLGTTVPELLGGEPSSPRPGGPDGGDGGERARWYSKPQPSDPKVLPWVVAA